MYSVSVIIPIFNGEKYLKKCLDSICDQTLRDIEIICINDGSFDNTEVILKEYASKDNRIKIISTENNGQGHARNIALNIATGEYVSFVDADDWIDLNSLELLYRAAKHNDLELLFFQMINYIENSGNLIETDLYNLQCFENHGISENIIFNYSNTKNFLFEIPVGPVSKFYKKEFLDFHMLRFPEGIFFEDNAFFYNVYFKCKKAGFLKKQLYYRRRHESSVTQTFDESKFDIIDATNEVLFVFKENEKYDVFKSDVINHTFSMLIEWFKKSPLYLKQSFFKLIKSKFLGFNELKKDFKNNLKEDYKLIFEIACENNYYLDFLSKYKLITSDYIIFDDGKEIEIKTEEYYKYKRDYDEKYKISVVIPIFNNENYIHRTLMSIENQSFGIENIEVLMIDDYSTDNTFEILKKYSNKYNGFKAIRLKKGSGSPGTPRNIGLLESTSEYVIFLDHDDLLEINALEVLYDAINNFNCDFVYGTYASVDEDLPTKIIYPNEKHGYFKSIFENERSIAFPPPSIWTKLFRREFLIRNNILFPTILGEDAIFISKALLNAEGVNYLWDSLICYHILDNKSYTKNISFKYLMEGFTSEEYMYDLYNSEHNNNYYKIRGEGILDFYLTQFLKSNLNKNEIINIFPPMFIFVNRLNRLGLTPHISEENSILFNLILNNDMESIINLKQNNLKSSEGNNFKNKFKSILKKILKKIRGNSL